MLGFIKFLFASLFALQLIFWNLERAKISDKNCSASTFLLAVKLETTHKPIKPPTNHSQISQTTHKPATNQSNHPQTTQKTAKARTNQPNIRQTTQKPANYEQKVFYVTKNCSSNAKHVHTSAYFCILAYICACICMFHFIKV